MNPAEIMALCASVTIASGFFFWVVKMIVQNAIRETVNGLKAELAVAEERMRAHKEEYDKLEKFVREGWHGRINQFTDALIESFKAGIEMGRQK